nr:retrovirus-related Pol polyprotein from transposon TNT 1-94 [Tanacetum cinerariifolium]
MALAGSARANIIQARGGIGANTRTHDSNVIPLPGLNSKQWETLLQMSKNGSCSIVKMNGKYLWIIDSGASHHMTGMIEELFNLKDIVQCPVELPDGYIAMAKKKGDIQPIVPSVNENEYNDSGLQEEPLFQDRGNELVNEETTVHDNQTVRDDDTITTITKFKKKSPSRSTPPAQSRSSGTPYPIAHYVNCDKFSSCHRTFLEAIEKEREPVTYYEAIKDKRWRYAIDSELEALEQNKTWMIEKLPSNKKALGCKWVYKIKYKSDGTIERFKADS